MSEPSYAERHEIEWEIQQEQHRHEQLLQTAKSALVELTIDAQALGWADLERHNLESALTVINRRMGGTHG